LHALSCFGEANNRTGIYLADRQLADGRWVSDKWNGSWLYTTCHTLVALHSFQASGLTERAVGASPSAPQMADVGFRLSDAMQRAVSAIMVAQAPDGGWGVHGVSTEETGYAVLALQTLRRDGMLDRGGIHGLQRGEEWLIQHYQPDIVKRDTCWLGKEAFRPFRLARMTELTATLRSLDTTVLGTDE
jgi:hypothetical protein